MVVLGGGSVGKSALTIQYVQGLFVTKYDPTIEDAYRKVVEVERKSFPHKERVFFSNKQQKAVELDGNVLVVDILDTAGVDTFSSMRDMYYRDGDGFILVYSSTSQASFNEMVDMNESLVRARECGSAPIFRAVAANKSDLVESRMVSSDKGADMATSWGAHFVETSAKNSSGVSEVFNSVLRDVIAHRAKMAATNTNTKSGRRKVTAACSLL